MNLSSLLRAPRAPAGGARALLGRYFKYHGLMAPGVRLLRRLDMRAKTLAVALAFSMPLALLLFHYVHANRAVLQGEQAAAEAVRVARALLARAEADGARAAPAAAAPSPGAGPRPAPDASESLARLRRELDAVEAMLSGQAAHETREQAAVLAAVVLSLMVGAYLLVAFHKVMHGGLEQVRDLVVQIAEGDLSARPNPWGRDEVAAALVSLRQSLSRLADLFAEVRRSVSAVSHASTEIASHNADLAARNDQAVAAIGEITGGVTRYVEQLKACGQRVDAVADAVEAMRLAAAGNRRDVGRLQQRMQLLQGKSRDIAEIVDVIDGIAFRTNILALNASVEAAKAGEAGRGFAVVAQEVRSLALRTAESSRRISAIIAGATEDIAQGSALAQMSAGAIVEAESNVARIHEAVGDVVTFTQEGLRHSQQILDEMRALSTSAAGSAELVRQLAAASNDLSAQGERLRDEVGAFKLTA